MRTILLTFGLIMLLALPTFAQNPSTSVTVSLTIEAYAYISFTDASCDITLTGGASGDCCIAGFNAGANYTATIQEVSFTPPPGAPGSWNNVITPPTLPGEGAGSVEICVAGITMSDIAGNWPGGEKVIEIVPTP